MCSPPPPGSGRSSPTIRRREKVKRSFDDHYTSSFSKASQNSVILHSSPWEQVAVIRRNVTKYLLVSFIKNIILQESNIFTKAKNTFCLGQDACQCNACHYLWMAGRMEGRTDFSFIIKDFYSGFLNSKHQAQTVNWLIIYGPRSPHSPVRPANQSSVLD